MASDKSGMWFLELILNILLLAGVTMVTFAARAEQERGLAVPLFAAVSPAVTRPAVDAPAKTPAVGSGAPAVPSVPVPAVPDAVKNVPGQVQAVGTQASKSFDQAWGALQLWAAGLDGKITSDELKKIQDSVGDGWGNTQAARDYLKGVNDRINAGQADQVVQEALQVVSQQANDKKTQVLKSVSDFMKSNGVTWEQTQQVMGRWVVQALKVSPMDVVNFVKSLDK